MTLVAIRHTLSAIAALALVTAIATPPTPATAQDAMFIDAPAKIGVGQISPLRNGKGYVAPATKGGIASAQHRRTTGEWLIRR